MRRFDVILFIVPVLSYVGLGLCQLRLPGLAYDEVFFGPAALGRTQDFLTPMAAEPVNSAARFSPLAFSTFSLSLGDISVPIMLMPYWGAVKVWLFAPWFAWYGVSVELIRLTAIGIGALTLVCFLGVLRSCFSPLIALLTGLFVATDPSYLFYTRHDFGGVGLSLFLMLAPLVCLIWWQMTRRVRYWAAAFGLWGLGLYHRLDFLAFLAALGGCGLWCLRPMLREWLGWKTLSIAVLAFSLGVSPLLLFAWQRPALAASSLALAKPTASISTSAEGRATDIAADMWQLMKLKGYVLGTVLNGMALYDFFANRSGVSVGRVTSDGEKRVGVYAPDQSLRLTSLLTGTATPYVLLFMVCCIWFFQTSVSLRAVAVFLGVFVGCLFLVRGALRGHHFIALVPVGYAFLVAAGWAVYHQLGQLHRRWAQVCLLALGIGCLGMNLTMDFRYHQLLSNTGGRGIWSEAIYDLAGYLQDQCVVRRCYLGDWGLGTQVVTLADSPLAVEEMFWSYLDTMPDSQKAQQVRLAGLIQTATTHASVFVFYTDRYVNFSRPKRLLYTAAHQADLAIVVEHVFTERDGTPVIEVVSLHAE